MEHGAGDDVRDAGQFGVGLWHQLAALTELDLMFLRLICYIAVIASAVQLVEMFIKKFSLRCFAASASFCR